MLISRAKAEEATTMLRSHYDGRFGEAKLTDGIVTDADTVKMLYNCAAFVTHPDRGGSAEAFARVDWAKHVLLNWLKQGSSRPPEHKTRKCGNCNGTGYIQTMIGFKLGPRKQCQPCRGTGDADFEPDEGEAR